MASEKVKTIAFNGTLRFDVNRSIDRIQNRMEYLYKKKPLSRGTIKKMVVLTTIKTHLELAQWEIENRLIK